jgi:hypothetical protein
MQKLLRAPRYYDEVSSTHLIIQPNQTTAATAHATSAGGMSNTPARVTSSRSRTGCAMCTLHTELLQLPSQPLRSTIPHTTTLKPAAAAAAAFQHAAAEIVGTCCRCNCQHNVLPQPVTHAAATKFPLHTCRRSR